MSINMAYFESRKAEWEREKAHEQELQRGLNQKMVEFKRILNIEEDKLSVNDYLLKCLFLEAKNGNVAAIKAIIVGDWVKLPTASE